MNCFLKNSGNSVRFDVHLSRIWSLSTCVFSVLSYFLPRVGGTGTMDLRVSIINHHSNPWKIRNHTVLQNVVHIPFMGMENTTPASDFFPLFYSSDIKESQKLKFLGSNLGDRHTGDDPWEEAGICWVSSAYFSLRRFLNVGENEYNLWALWTLRLLAMLG